MLLKESLTSLRNCLSVRRRPGGQCATLVVEQLEPRALLSYLVTDLGTLGGDFSEASALNALGDVVGRSEIAAFPHPYHAFRYSAGVMTDLDTFGSTYSSADAINDSGQVAGSVFTSGVNTHAYLVSDDGPMQDLGTLGGDTSAAFGINNRGWVVGQAAVEGTFLTHAFLYRHGHMIDLGTLGGSRSTALGINHYGWVVGASEAPGGYHAFLWRHRHMTDLGTLGGSVSSAQAVNALGQVAGDSDLAFASGYFPHHAFLWKHGQFTDLGTLGGYYSYAFGLNNYGQVVGYAALPDNTSAPFLYADGVMTNLNDLIPPSWTLSQARGINDAGQIVGYGSDSQGGIHALLLTPDTQSSAGSFLGLGPAVAQVAAAFSGRHPAATTSVTADQLPGARREESEAAMENRAPLDVGPQPTTALAPPFGPALQRTMPDVTGLVAPLAEVTSSPFPGVSAAVLQFPTTD
jgi:probable HAF family extracellular repeat protein